MFAYARNRDGMEAMTHVPALQLLLPQPDQSFLPNISLHKHTHTSFIAMSKTAQSTKNTISLKGSAQIVTEFFGYSINRYEIE